MAVGDRGLTSWLGREHEFRGSVAIAAEIGATLGCRSFNALYGNRVPGVPAEKQDELAIDQLAFAADAVAAIDIAAATGHENVLVLADFYLSPRRQRGGRCRGD